MFLNGLPPFAVVQLHPIIFSILDFSRVLQRLGEQVSQVIVIGSVLESQVADIGQIGVQLIYMRC